MENFKIAAQLYTLRNLLKDKSREKIFDVLKQIKKIGYDAVQISGVGDVDSKIAQNFKEACEELELEICATHLSLGFLKNNLDWVIEYHKMWQCKYVGIGSMPNSMRNLSGALEFADKCNELGKKLKEHNLYLIYHNHKFEFERFNDKILMEHLYESFNQNYIEFEIDTYWVQAGGANPVEWIYKVDGRMSVIHFKDFRITNDEQQFAEIGQGNLDWQGIIKACEDTGVLYAAIEQDSFMDDPINVTVKPPTHTTSLKTMR